MLELRPLRFRDNFALRRWRNINREAWRDPRKTTLWRQFRWWFKIGRKAPWIFGAYHWIFNRRKPVFVGQTQLYPIDARGGCVTGEIGMVVNPEFRRLELGTKILRLTLDYGFNVLGLDRIWGEVYDNNESKHFWLKYAPYHSTEHNCHAWQGKVYDSHFFWWNKDEE